MRIYVNLQQKITPRSIICIDFFVTFVVAAMILCYSEKLQYARITLIFILLTIANRQFYISEL